MQPRKSSLQEVSEFYLTKGAVRVLKGTYRSRQKCRVVRSIFDVVLLPVRCERDLCEYPRGYTSRSHCWTGGDQDIDDCHHIDEGYSPEILLTESRANTEEELFCSLVAQNLARHERGQLRLIDIFTQVIGVDIGSKNPRQQRPTGLRRTIAVILTVNP